MITGQPGPLIFSGIWNCTYTWPIVICCGVGAGGVCPGGAPGIDACSVIFVCAADEEAALIDDRDGTAGEPLLRRLRGDVTGDRRGARSRPGRA